MSFIILRRLNDIKTCPYRICGELASNYSFSRTHIMLPTSDFPDFLQSYERLVMHFQEQFADSDSRIRGDVFADFVGKLIPRTEFAKGFDVPVKRPHSYDEGVDFQADRNDGALLSV